MADFLLRCQTYEGGFGGEPFNEAHGGYNFCALAGLLILGQVRRSVWTDGRCVNIPFHAISNID